MPEQRTHDWAATASDAEIRSAYNAGELNLVLGRQADAPVQRTESWVRASTPEEIDAARVRGELDEYLGRNV
jgi:hypothetical protein